MARKMTLEPRVLGARLFMTLWLAFAWVLLWGSIDIGTIAAGLIVATVVMAVLPLPRVPVEGLLRPVSMVWLVIVVAYYLVRSSFAVAWLSVRPQAPPRSAVLRAPMRLKSDFTLALAVNTLNLMPGGIVVRVDPAARYVYIHVLNTGTDDAVEHFRSQTAHIETLYQRAFERDEDWKPSPEHYSAPADSAPTTVGTADPADPADPADSAPATHHAAHGHAEAEKPEAARAEAEQAAAEHSAHHADDAGGPTPGQEAPR
ncbi:Na+/H+ antiporter subunit E [Dietzia kunjamensis]|uniref:Na+/H+ antiporter subunit E n=1 Tax=Dietzia TaxID=37914 RepID=UPI0021AE6288|nr:MULTISPECIES: Na+/H+ antiporter subunit E [Dietzia]MCT1432713.1 Na+/H+ antiporter subunit E [Dietzia maris]MCT1522288.1 Na+/H+ antiporter subunit E [Dietzia maris]MCY1658152.1 Na+/H+ antiporter subunit E [Dietzia sp. SL131]MDJ0423629.1 Na+/H+ antiporter subunit E [Dietzia kunjamensis]